MLPAHSMTGVVITGWRVSQREVDISMQVIVKLVLVQQARQKIGGKCNEESLWGKKSKKLKSQANLKPCKMLKNNVGLM